MNNDLEKLDRFLDYAVAVVAVACVGCLIWSILRVIPIIILGRELI